MILTRPGNKRKLAQTILTHFPEHDLYIEPFFGAGGMFFNKPQVKHNIVNDYDSEVYNLFKVIVDRKEELARFWEIMPIHEDLWKYWKENTESDPIRKAARFLFFSNFSFMGRMTTLKFDRSNTYWLVLMRLNEIHKQLQGVQLMNCDFRDVLRRISIRKGSHQKAFIYADPPYLDTKGGNYDAFGKQDSIDLFNCLLASGCKFAISEFDHPFILELARINHLRVIPIGERQNMKNRRMEILITNY
ncbi:DNA adenine methylase [Spirosoma sordidisoli]|uniref:site-specific DNA-methyltransferase (adenine-specific) n=1 Tax=Spirosoma sordidisoli TaxID=2502893 RepID=A0A4Q2USF0_9BACT|nr:DNA adenine methylase [Spirosoma sordidisoli]RYC69759.1 DNA adenine methylase [Spirosoma sordidisoli]